MSALHPSLCRACVDGQEGYPGPDHQPLCRWYRQVAAGPTKRRTSEPTTYRQIEPSQAKLRSTVALHRLANALGLTIYAEQDDCLILEQLAAQAERWRRFDQLVDVANSTRRKAYHEGYGSDHVEHHEQGPEVEG